MFVDVLHVCVSCIPTQLVWCYGTWYVICVEHIYIYTSLNLVDALAILLFYGTLKCKKITTHTQNQKRLDTIRYMHVYCKFDYFSLLIKYVFSRKC